MPMQFAFKWSAARMSQAHMLCQGSQRLKTLMVVQQRQRQLEQRNACD